MRMRIKRSFTLLEILIALMILSTIGAICSVQIKKLIDAHRFEQEVSTLFSALQEAQVLAATYQTDIALDIQSKKNQITYQFTTDEPFQQYPFNQKTIPLKHTAHATFQKAKTAQLHFDIYSGGRIEPCGILAFSGPNSKTLWFDLQRSHLPKFAAYQPKPYSQKEIPKPKKK